MARFAHMRTLDIWYARLSEDQLLETINMAVSTPKGRTLKKAQGLEKAARKNIAKARTRDSLQAFSTLAELVDGKYRIVSQPPIVIPLRELGDAYGMSPDEVEPAIRGQLRSSREKDTFDRSVTDFSEGYADQDERDEAFATAVRSGRLEASDAVQARPPGDARSPAEAGRSNPSIGPAGP